MHRVLSFQMSRNVNESSEFVTKRLCFSFLFSVGFLCLLCGFLLGRFAAERSMEAQTQKMRLELTGNGLQNTEHLQQLMLRELKRASFNYDKIEWEAPDLTEANIRRIDGFFSNLSFIHKVDRDHASCVRAIVRGSREPDRYVVLSVNGDGIAIILEMAQILDRIYSTYDWRPRRTLIFCMSLGSSNVCPQTLSSFIRQKIVAYVTLHGRAAQGNDRIVVFGSDVIRFAAVEAIKTIPDSFNWTYLEHEIFGPRLSLNIPHVSFSFNENNFSETRHNQSSRSHSVTLAEMISQTIWRLSEIIIIRWEPRYFNETVNKILESIDKLRDAKEEKQKRTLLMLKTLIVAVNDLNLKIDATENTQMLHVRIWNDLLLDLDRALLCPDEKSRSKTDLAILGKLLLESTDKALIYLDEMGKCYENAIRILVER